MRDQGNKENKRRKFDCLDPEWNCSHLQLDFSCCKQTRVGHCNSMESQWCQNSFVIVAVVVFALLSSEVNPKKGAIAQFDPITGNDKLMLHKKYDCNSGTIINIHKYTLWISFCYYYLFCYYLNCCIVLWYEVKGQEDNRWPLKRLLIEIGEPIGQNCPVRAELLGGGGVHQY